MSIERCSVADLLAVTGNDPFVRSQARYRFGPAWRDGAEGATTYAVAFISLDAEGRARHLAAVGDPRWCAPLVTRAVQKVPEVPRLSFPRGTFACLPDWLRPENPTDWDFRAARSAAPEQVGEDRAYWLDAADDPDVKELLVAANPTTSTWPGETKVRRWAGIRDQHGRLDACLADTSSPGVGHFSGIATRPEARGQGLGTAITSWATRSLLDEGCDIVTLGMYADNTAARRVYDRLGFSNNHHFTSGVLTPAKK